MHIGFPLDLQTIWKGRKKTGPEKSYAWYTWINSQSHYNSIKHLFFLFTVFLYFLIYNPLQRMNVYYPRNASESWNDRRSETWRVTYRPYATLSLSQRQRKQGRMQRWICFSLQLVYSLDLSLACFLRRDWNSVNRFLILLFYLGNTRQKLFGIGLLFTFAFPKIKEISLRKSKSK